jgi:hypothetical protein
MKSVKRFGVKGKLAPHYIGAFPIIEKCGTMAYKLELRPSLAGAHDMTPWIRPNPSFLLEPCR